MLNKTQAAHLAELIDEYAKAKSYMVWVTTAASRRFIEALKAHDMARKTLNDFIATIQR